MIEVHKITRFDSRLGMEGEKDKGPRMPSSFLNYTALWMALISIETVETYEAARFGGEKVVWF